MRVLYFHQHFTTPAQSGGTRSYEFAQALIKRGHHVIMVCGETAKLNLSPTKKYGRNVNEGIVDGIDVIQIKLPYSNKDGILKRANTFVKYALKGIKIAWKEKYDLIFATSTPLTVCIPGIIMKFFKKKKFVFEVRDLWPELPKALGMKNPILLLGMRILEYLGYHCADACIGLSPGICDGIKQKSQSGKRIALIPNGCDVDIFKPQKQKRQLLEGIDPNSRIAIFAGTHGVANGLDSVLDAANVLKERHREDILLVFVGEGKTKPHLIKRAREEGLDNCRFYNSMPKNYLAEIVGNADVGLQVLANIPAFYYGTSPNKFFDYISSGIPVLNNYPGWLADIIQKNELGIVVSPDNPQAFADGLIRLIDNDEYRIRCGINARRFAIKNFSRKKLSDKFVAFLEDITYN